MTQTAQAHRPIDETTEGLSSRFRMLFAISAAFFLAGFLPIEALTRLMFAAMGLTLAFVGLALLLLALRDRRSLNIARERVLDLVGNDAAPTFGTDGDGQVDFQNEAARARFGARGGQSIAHSLGALFANPSAVLFRLQSKAAAVGQAREDVVTRSGHVRLSVHRIAEGRFLWRLEEMLERSSPTRGAEAIGLPMLIVSKTDTILFMNEALRRLLGGRMKSLDRVFATLPVRSGEETRISGADGPVRAMVAEVEGVGERREIYLFPASDTPPEAAANPTGFEDLPVALARLESNGTVASANRFARDLLGLEAEEEPRFSDLVEGLGRPVGDWLADVLAARAPSRSEVLRATRTGEDRFLQVTLHRTVEQGRPGVIAVLNDATELKSLEAQFAQSQKMQAIGQLAGGVAHDFNNLLTAISGHCDLLLLRHEKGDPDYADLVQVHQNSNRAASLVGQLLAFSRKQTLKPEVLELRDTLADLTHLLNRLVGERVTLSLHHGVDLKPIRADKRQLEQVIMNLVVNARDAMPGGGTIWIETEKAFLKEDLHRDRANVPAGEYVLIRVRDEGIGIPNDRLQKIFEPFFTTKRTGEGTGLGLSTAYGIVKQTGGFIFVDSIPGSGTTFSLYFPAHERVREDEPSPAPPERSILRHGDGVILLVEDEAPVRAFASRALRLRGYSVIEAENAEQALKVLEDEAVSVDVFVTDVIMPGMDGPSWVREALKKRPDVRVVFVSGYAEDSFAETQARIPNSVFLPKPFSLVELTTTVQGQLQ